MADSLRNWWNNEGFVTKHLVAGSALLSLAATIGLAYPQSFLWSWRACLSHHQWWRAITGLLFQGTLSRGGAFIGVIMNTLVFMNFSSRCESMVFARTGDYVFALLVMGVGILVLGTAFGFSMLSLTLTMALVWVFCQRFGQQNFNLFGFDLQAAYLPWAMVFIAYIMNGGNIQASYTQLLGIAVGFGYLFLADQANLRTPAFIHTLVPDHRHQGWGFAAHMAQHMAQNHPLPQQHEQPNEQQQQPQPQPRPAPAQHGHQPFPMPGRVDGDEQDPHRQPNAGRVLTH